MNVLTYFDAMHPAPTWGSWRVFVKAVDGIGLDKDELGIFRQHTNRLEPTPSGYPEAVCVVGVQSGKSRVAATLAVHAALTGENGTHALLIGQDHRGAMRTLLRYVREPFEVPAFKTEVVRDVADTLELANGVSLSAYPCRPSSVRGLRACIVVVDELAFFIATDGRATDVEMLRACRGRVATTGGKLIVLSSPYGQSGALWDLHRKHFGEDSSTLVWQASAPDMNPTLPVDYLQRMEQDDPEAFRSEVLGEFRAGISTLFDPDALTACVTPEQREREPQGQKPYWLKGQWCMPKNAPRYVAFVDASSGSGKDSFTTAIAHADGEVMALDALRVRKPPFDPSSAIAESAALLKAYGLSSAWGDSYAPGFVLEGFRQAGIRYQPSAKNRSELYLELVPLVNAGRVALLDLPEMLRELRGLERRRGTGGRDRVDHRSGAHDDQANAAAGALVTAASIERLTMRRVPVLWG